MLDIGATLKSAREQQGIALDDAAEATKIRESYLVALEEEAFERLPGATYARGFVRSYAEFLGLDPQPLIDEFNARSAAPKGPRRSSSRRSTPTPPAPTACACQSRRRAT